MANRMILTRISGDGGEPEPDGNFSVTYDYILIGDVQGRGTLNVRLHEADTAVQMLNKTRDAAINAAQFFHSTTIARLLLPEFRIVDIA
jgi:hypothetical protein